MMLVAAPSVVHQDIEATALSVYPGEKLLNLCLTGLVAAHGYASATTTSYFLGCTFNPPGGAESPTCSRKRS